MTELSVTEEIRVPRGGGGGGVVRIRLLGKFSGLRLEEGAARTV